MGFKSDREFLRNVSIGAVGTRKVADVLRRGGFKIIELERYCTSNKIWASKIKRLRVPDLLCLKTGIRIESRAKSKLEVTMSHAVNNPDRAWDKGLRGSDLIAFVRCLSVHDSWQACETVALFVVDEMRSTAAHAGLSQMKSASEGSEIRLTWAATVPGTSGEVTGVSASRIDTRLATGRAQSYRLSRTKGPSLIPYVAVGTQFGDGDTVLASLMPTLVPPAVPSFPAYDFLADLKSTVDEDVYVAVKALGHLPALAARSKKELQRLSESNADQRIKLESIGSLARLGEPSAWQKLEAFGLDKSVELPYRMEVALILTELASPEAFAILSRLAAVQSHESELRAASVWGLGANPANFAEVLPFVSDTDEMTAVHAIVAASREIGRGNIARALNAITDDARQSAGVVRAILSCSYDYVADALVALTTAPAGARRQWLLYLLAASGRQRCETVVRAKAPQTITELEFFWSHHDENWTNRLDVADQIDFLARQS